MSAVSNADEIRRWRGMALELVYTAFQNRQSAYDYDKLWSVMLKLGQSVGLNDVVFVCRWLRDSGYLAYEEEHERWTHKPTAKNLRITPKGCAVVEGTHKDSNVWILIG